MKTTVITLATALSCLSAFAQGKVSFRNDSLHLVYFATDANSIMPGDTPGGAVPLGFALSLDLFAGTSSSSLVKVATTTMNSTGTPGTFGPMSVVLPFGGGSGQYFQIQAYSTSAGSEAAAEIGQGFYFGNTEIFTANSGASLTYNSLVAAGAPSFSTWAVGTQSEDSVLPGAKGALEIWSAVPEPTSFALLGLGAFGLLVLHRRK